MISDRTQGARFSGRLCHLEVKGYKGDSELAAKETPFTIGAHETFTTVISADDFLDSKVIDFGTPDVPVSESGEPLNYDFNGDGTIDDSDIMEQMQRRCGIRSFL